MHVDVATITCCANDCGISFQVPSWWYKGKRETHTRFYCPNGHPQLFLKESDLEKMTRERNIARQQVARAEEEAEQARRGWEKSEKVRKKLEKRAAAGTCPCCQRTFNNMSRHMKTKHPEFVADNVVKLKA